MCLKISNNTAKSQIIVLEHNEFFKKKQTNIEI